MSYRATATGSLVASGTTAANYVTLPCRHQVPVLACFQLLGTFSGTILLEHTLDGTNWVARDFVSGVASGTLALSATAPGIFTTPAAIGLPLAYRVRCSAYSSGTIGVVLTLLPVA